MSCSASEKEEEPKEVSHCCYKEKTALQFWHELKFLSLNSDIKHSFLSGILFRFFLTKIVFFLFFTIYVSVKVFFFLIKSRKIIFTFIAPSIGVSVQMHRSLPPTQWFITCCRLPFQCWETREPCFALHALLVVSTIQPLLEWMSYWKE